VEQELRGGFLPPNPPGPEPELDDGPRRPTAAGRHAAPGEPPHPPADPPSSASTWHVRPYGAPAPRYGSPPPAGWDAPPWGFQTAAREPDNGPAVAGFVLSLVAAGLLLFSVGLSTFVSIACAIAGIVLSRKGRRKVDAGETSKNRGLAQAGFVVGVVSLVLAVLATIFWALIVVLALVDDDFQRDLENEFDDSNRIRASVGVAAGVLRLGMRLLS
jgi:MFS family permease